MAASNHQSSVTFVSVASVSCNISLTGALFIFQILMLPRSLFLSWIGSAVLQNAERDEKDMGKLEGRLVPN